MAQLEDLSDDILFIVLQFLEREHISILQQFRLVSWRLKDFAESQLYKDVTVGDDEDLIDATNRFVERLTDCTDALSRHVRHFTVASFEGDSSSSCLNTSVLVKLMGAFQGLASFSWNVDILMPREVLDAFHEQRPNTRLCVKTKIFDPVLLSSPQLYRLDISVACQKRFSLVTSSLFRRLKNILVQIRSLRVLSIDIHQDPHVRRLALGEADRGNLNLPLEPGETMPPLEELTILARDYVFDKAHIDQWVESMDWRRLRRLSFGLSNPGMRFLTILPHTPELQSLAFGYSGPMAGGEFDEAYERKLFNSQMSTIFVTIIGGLKELDIRSRLSDFDQDHLRLAADKHGQCLRRLTIRDWNTYLVNTISTGLLDSLGSFFPRLTQLDIDLSLFLRQGRLTWDPDNVTALARMSTLKHLKISIQNNQQFDQYLMYEASPQSPHRLLPELWDAFFAHDPASDLIQITLRFWRWEEGSSMFRDVSKRVRMKEIFYVGSKPNDDFKVKVLGGSEKVSVYASPLSGGSGFV